MDDFYPEVVSSLRPPTKSSCNQQRLAVPNPLASVQPEPDPELTPDFSSSSAPLQTNIDYNSVTYADDKLVVEDTTRSEIVNEVCAEVISCFPIISSSSNRWLSVPNPLATVHHHDSQLKPDFTSSAAPLETSIDYSSATCADDKLVSTTTRSERINEVTAPVCVSPSSSASGKAAPPAVPAKVEVAAKMPKNNLKKRRRSISSTRSSEGDVEVELEKR